MGRNGTPPPDEGSERSRDSGESSPLDGRPEDLEAADQTLSDGDQTLSDRDQTLSDRDQQASDEDQATADMDRDHGGDRDVYELTTSRRAARTQERDEVSALRDLTAQERDSAAIRRDALALLHDEVAETHDKDAAASDSRDTAADDAAKEIEEVRARARAGRIRAAQDRELAAYDRRHAGTDELTGARRRGVGIEELQSEIERARRHGDGLVAAYIDVDGLKSVNDSKGHVAGDRLLRNVADGLRSRMRSYDLLMRIGGDEFLCVLPGIGVDEARRRLHDLGPAGPQSWSISIGVSVLRDSDEAQQLIDRADQDLIETRRRR